MFNLGFYILLSKSSKLYLACKSCGRSKPGDYMCNMTYSSTNSLCRDRQPYQYSPLRGHMGDQRDSGCNIENVVKHNLLKFNSNFPIPLSSTI